MKQKRIFSLLVALTMLFSCIGTVAMAEEVAVPAGNIQVGYFTTNYNNSGRHGIYGEAINVVGTKSFKVMLYSGEELVGTAELVDNNNVLLNGTKKTVSWHILLGEDNDSCWNTNWIDGAMKVNKLPNKVELHVDGEKVSEGEVKLNSADSSYPIIAVVADENANVQSFVAADGYVNNISNVAGKLSAAIASANANNTVTLLRDITSADGIKITDKNLTIDLNGHTFKVTEGSSTNSRNFLINGNSIVTIKNGTLVADGAINSGTYGTVRTEGTANVTLNGLKLYNYRGNGLNIKAYTGTTVNVSDTEIYSQYGGGIEAAGATMELTNVTVEQKGMWTAPYNSMAISVNGEGKVTVNSGSYTTEPLTAEEANGQGTSHGSWAAGVLNSGGTLIIKGGTFTNGNFGEDSLATAARGLILADTGANLQIEGGTFNALKSIIDIQNNLGDASKNPTGTISGGTFSADPTNGYVKLADGFEVKENSDGTFGVATEKAMVAKIGDVPYSDLYTAMTSAKSGETVELLSDVDLSDAEWEPVSFAGKFNGNGFKIKNLTINKPGVSNTGFIASLNGSFENVTFENSTVKGGECTGVLAGRAGGSAAYAKDIKVTGTIKVETTHSGYARAGIIVGGWAYGKYENITVDGTDKAVSYIKHTGGGDGRYVAGIVGHADDVDEYINCAVKNITISGGWLCGGIAGPGPSDGIATGCTVENIDMGADYSGGMFGWYYGSGTIENSTIKDVTFTAGSTKNGAIGGYSNNDAAAVSNVTIENVKNANGSPLLSDAIEVTCADGTVEYYDDMADAVRDDQISYLEGATIKLLKDYTGKGIRFLKPGMVLDLNGFTYTVNSGEGSNGSKTSCFQVKADSGNTLSIVKNGTIKIAPKEERGAEPNIYWVFNSYTGLNIENVTIDCTNLDDYQGGLYSFVVYTGDGKTTNLTGTTSIINYTNGGYSIANRGATSVTNIDTTGKIEGILDTDGNTIVKNGIFTNNVSQFCEDGYVTVKNADGFYVVAKAPNAEVSVLKPMSLEPGYIIWPGGDNSIKRPLEIVMNFKTNETTEEARPNGFLSWKVDFYLEFEGLTNKTITADNCYLAGKYGTIGWVVIPTDGLTLEEGVEYPVVAAYDANITYKQICDDVKDFTAAIHVDQAILDANPDFKVKLSLKMTNPNDANDVLTIGEPAVYTAEDLKNAEAEVEYFNSGVYVLRTFTPMAIPETEQKIIEKLGVDEAYRVRVYAAVEDETKYKELGFMYKLKDAQDASAQSGKIKTLYEKVNITTKNEGTIPYEPKNFRPDGKYIFALNIWMHPAFGPETVIEVKPYGVKNDETTIYGSKWITTGSIGGTDVAESTAE